MNIQNVAFVGAAAVGKTRFLEKYFELGYDVQFPQKHARYVSSVGVQVRPYAIGNTVVNFWDCAGNNKFITPVLDTVAKKCDVVAILHDGSADEWIGNIKKIDKDYVLLDVNTIRNKKDADNWIVDTLV